VVNDYRRRFFASYHLTHVAYLDSNNSDKLDWFEKYVKKYYLPIINGLDKNFSKILEIGCNKGFVLAVLNSLGFKNLYGIDLSPEDIEIAKKMVPDANIACADAFDYLDNNAGQYDAIILKAVLEHMRKDEGIPFLEKIKEGLKPGGLVVIDVPNMDWLFASHERYMDFTHEVGFTKESLRQLMNNVFSDVRVIPADNIFLPFFFGGIKKRVARFILQRFLCWADGQGGTNPIWERSIIGFGKK
jgi:SAM-dependent methyltransferase